MSDNFNKERIIKNTALLYLRMAFTMWLNLYATRLVLKNLGVDDMGVYGVVGSIVSLFAVFSNGITTAIQRFITFELGKPDGKVNNVFCTSINIIFLLSGVILLLLETMGLWYLTNKANIPEASTNAAFWVFQISVLTCIINMISVPYNALIIAHEKMNVFAFISILQVVLSCAAAYCLTFFSNHRLLIYAALLAGIGILIRIINQAYCRKKIKESQYRWMIDKDCIKEMGKFTGVTTLSSILSTIYGQTIILIINMALGVVFNTIYTIALQVKNSILSFSFNIFRAIDPQITKTFACNDITTCKKIIYTGIKIELFLTLFIIIPFLFRTEFIMDIWLDDYPEYTISYVRYLIILCIFNAIYEPIRSAVLASNKIIAFMLTPNILYIICLPIIYYININANEPIILIQCVVFIDVIIYFIRLYLARKSCTFMKTSELLNILTPIIGTIILSSFVCYILSLHTDVSIKGFIILFLINSISLAIIIYFIGLNKSERRTIINSILSIKKSISRYHKNE